MRANEKREREELQLIRSVVFMHELVYSYVQPLGFIEMQFVSVSFRSFLIVFCFRLLSIFSNSFLQLSI